MIHTIRRTVPGMPRQRSLLSVVVICSVLSGCGSTPTADEPTDAPEASGDSKVVVVTDDGTTLEFTNFEVSCPADTQDQWGTDARVVYAIAGVDGTPSMSRHEPTLTLTAAETVADGTSTELAHSEDWASGTTFVSAFITVAGDTTELSSADEESSGSIEVTSASCEPTPHLELSIDARLHSEYSDGGRATVNGHVRTG